MILVDSGVWIDYFGDRPTLQTIALEKLLKERLTTGDLILAEVLQGCRTDQSFRYIRQRMLEFDLIAVVDFDVAEAAAHNYRHLRTLGITPRKTIDTLIATRCIVDRIPLLYSNRDFDPFVQHLGLISAMSLPGAL